MSTNTNSSCRHYGCNRPFAQQQADSRGKEFHEATCHHRVVGCGSGAPCQRPLNAWLDACSSGKLMLSRCREHNSSILISAVKNDDRVLLTYLLDAVEPSNLLENLEAETSSGDTALTLAARCGRYRILTLLLEYISHRNCSLAVVHNETTRGATALIEATRQNHSDCVDLLLRHAHSDPNRLSKVHAKSAIDWAADFDRDNILVELEKQSKVIKDFKLLCSVIARADVDTLREMVDAGEPYDIIRNIGYVSRLEVCAVDTEQTLEGHKRDVKELPRAISGQTREIEIARGNLESASAEVSKQKQVVDAVVREEKDLIEGSNQLFRSGITSLQASMIPSNVAELSSMTKPGSDLMMISKVIVLLISAGREKGDESRAAVTGNAKANLDEYWEEMLREMDNLQNFFHRLRHYDVNHRLTPEAAESIDDIITSGAINTTGDAHRIQPGAVGGGTGGSFLIQALASWAKAVHVCKANHGTGKEICNRLAQERQRLDRFAAVEQSRQNDLAVTERRRSMLRQEHEEAGKRLAMSNRKLRNAKQKLHLHRLMSHVSESGYSLLSWASAHGIEDVVDILIDHGANLGLGDEHLSLAARLIQETYRHHRWNTGTNMSRSNAESHQRHIAHRLLVKMYGRLLSHRRRHVRSPLAEAYFNGRPKVALLLEKRSPHFHLMMYRPRKPCGVIPRLALPMDKSTVQDISECIIQGRLLFESNSWEDGIGALEVSEGEDNDSCDCMTHLTAMKKRAVVEVERLKRERACVRRARKHQTRLSQARIQMNQAIRESNYQMMVEIVGENANEGEEDDEVKEWISLDWETKDGITPLIQAAMDVDNGASAVSFLLDRKRGRPSIDYETKVGGDTALTVAARCGRLTAVEALLDRGATLDRQCVSGDTALIVAGKEGRPRVVQMLLERGSAVSIKDGDDRTARDYALENNHQDVVAILEAYAQRGFLGLARAVYGTSHNSVLCQFGCGTMENMGERLDEHHRKCPRRPCRCPLCGMLVEAKDMSDHDENDCSERPVTCPLCQDRIALSSIDEHKAKECHKRKVECPRCSSRINADLVEKHKSYICQYRLVHCSLGCGSQVEFCDLQRHRRSECPRRTVRCKKCNDLLPLDELKEHEARDICAGNYNRS